MSELMNVNKNEQLSRTPKLIAAEINSIKEQTKRMVLYNSIEIGRRLIEAKEMLDHGQWGTWLKESVDYSQSTANNLMRIFNEYGSEQLTLLGDNAKSQALGNLSYTQAVALLGIPAEEREEFVKENDIENISTRELQKIIKEKEKALKEKEAALKKYNELELNYNKKAEEAKELLDSIKKAESEKSLIDLELKEANEQIKKLQESEDEEEKKRLNQLIQNKETEVTGLNKKIEELEGKLKEKPIEVVANETIVEKIPEEIEKELNELREKVNKKSSEAIVKYTVYFNEAVKVFKDLLGSISGIEEEEKEKYKKATSGLLNKMLETLK